jgi:hypothetical protein
MIVGYWDVFRSLLDQIAHEDDLLVSRTFWLLVSQFLLLLGYLSIDKNKLPQQPALDHFRIIGGIGILSTTFIYSAILASEVVFVELRTRIYQLTTEHSDLPMRKLPSVGLGSGLLCPILLALVVLFLWVLLTVGSRWAAVLTATSGALFAVFFVGEAHQLMAGSEVALLIGSSLPLAMAVLAVAVLVGVVASRHV